MTVIAQAVDLLTRWNERDRRYEAYRVPVPVDVDLVYEHRRDELDDLEEAAAAAGEQAQRELYRSAVWRELTGILRGWSVR